MRRVRDLLAGETVEYDLHLISSHARGGASPISDVDLVMYSPRGAQFGVGGHNIRRRCREAVRIEFYAANNPFKARLIYGDGEGVRRLREEIYGRRIDLEATKSLWVGPSL